MLSRDVLQVVDLQNAVAMNREDDLRRLLARGFSPDAIGVHGNEGEPMLHIAASKAHVGICKILLEAGANVHAEDDRGRTALHRAAEWGGNVCELLLDYGSDIEAVTRLGKTPLFYAISGDNEKTFNLLLERGAKVRAETKLGLTPLHLAADNSRLDFCQKLIERKALVSVKARVDRDFCIDPQGRVTPLHMAVRRGHLGICRLLVASGANPSQKGGQLASGSYLTPLQLAVELNRLEIVRFFLHECHADVHQRTKGNLKRTLFDIAGENAPMTEVLRSAVIQQNVTNAIDVSANEGDASPVTTPARSSGMSML